MKRQALLLLCGAALLTAATILLQDRGDSSAEAQALQRRKLIEPSTETMAAPVTATLPDGLVTLRIDFRSKGKPGAKQATAWDGSLTVSRGRVRSIRPWQEDPRSRVDGTSWKLTTRHTIPWNKQQRERGHKAMPLKDAALVIELTDTVPETELQFTTAQGDFSVKLEEIVFGARKGFLAGLAQVARSADTAMILSAPSEDDYPAAAAGPDGELYVAYVAFTHGKGFRARPLIATPPEDYGYLAQPVGGDQVMLLKLDGDAWTGPLAVTPPGQDVYRPAVTVDGDGRVWVFWSAAEGDNWDLYARYLSGETWSKPIRLTTDAGADSFPVATTDGDGRVWVAWQAFRDGGADILAMRQEGDTLGEPITVTDAPGNQWAPAIAASKDGRVAVAWDSYENGNYDVFCRIFSGGKFGDVTAIATSVQAEMRPSITFDGEHRLWVAYEESPEGWGKDWGALEKSGVALYQRRSVAVRVLSQGRLAKPADDPIYAFTPWLRTARGRTGRSPNLALPRLTCDDRGRVWMAVRSPRLGSRVGVGTVWFEHLAWYEGDRWSGEIVCPGTDNILDNRPALVPRGDGRIAMINSTDGRFASTRRLPAWFVRELRKEGQQFQQKTAKPRWPDRVNNELMMAQLGPAPGGAARRPVLEPVEAGEPATAVAEAKKEAQDVAQARAARATVGGKTLQLLRGEFHRHTELSPDGGGDGLLLDMWRYGIDAAALDWIGNGDHDNGNGREYSWWIVQKTTSLFQLTGRFTPMYTYERSCNYPDGHRNVVFAQRGVRPLARLQNGKGQAMDDLPQGAKRPNTPDTLMLYDYLRQFDGICASHTSGTNMGTDWRDNDPQVEPIVEIYQGCRQSYEMPGAPRSNTAERSLGGWRPFGFVSLALKKGMRLGFQASSDHVSTHISYCNIWAEGPTREAILAAMKARHIYGATDNIVADVRCGEHFMGDEFTVKTRPTLTVRLVGTQPFAKVHVIKDNLYVHSIEPNKQTVEFEWTDFKPTAGKTSYYYVRGEQEDGELVWVSPMWITYQP